MEDVYERVEDKTSQTRQERPQRGATQNSMAEKVQGHGVGALSSQAESGGHDFIGNEVNCRF